jgi:hypothetical protein
VAVLGTPISVTKAKNKFLCFFLKAKGQKVETTPIRLESSIPVKIFPTKKVFIFQLVIAFGDLIITSKVCLLQKTVSGLTAMKF